MKIGFSFLIAALLAVPLSFASATPPEPTVMYFNVPYELTGIPESARQAIITCRVGESRPDRNGIFNCGPSGCLGEGHVTIDLPPGAENRNLRGVARVTLHSTNPMSAHTLRTAHEYACVLTSPAGQPEIKGESPVTGNLASARHAAGAR